MMWAPWAAKDSATTMRLPEKRSSPLTVESSSAGFKVLTFAVYSFKRSVSIQDVNAPPSVVWGRIMDLPKYPKMVEGCVECEPYRTEKGSGGAQVVYSRYKIRAAGLTMEYFMKHIYEPKKHCMTFHLDYDRFSELSDTVGYW